MNGGTSWTRCATSPRRECGTKEQLDALTDGGTESHNHGLYVKLAELGYFGAGIEEEYGGSGGTIVDACLLMEEVFYAGIPLFGLTTSLTVAEAIRRHGSEEQKREWLGAMCEGSVHALGFSEPEAGSDLGSLRCARRAGRRRLPDQRPEDLDLERPVRRSRPAHGPHRRRPTPATPASRCSTSR